MKHTTFFSNQIQCKMMADISIQLLNILRAVSVLNGYSMAGISIRRIKFSKTASNMNGYSMTGRLSIDC